MRRAAAKKTTTARDTIDEESERMASVMNAKQQFLTSTADMSWRLAIMVVVPIVGGVKLDERFDTAPSFTLLGFMTAAAGGCYVVWRTLKNLNEEQRATLRSSKKKVKGKK